jgi:hypothetical protein
MPRPSVFDHDELRAYWSSGRYQYATELMEAMGIPDEHRRAVQRAINRYFGPQPRRVVRNDVLRRRVIAEMVARGLDPHRCHACSRVTTMPMYLRELAQDDAIGSLVFVCRRCKRAGDV